MQIPKELQVSLYRDTRELLVNVIKHADAKNVDVSIKHQDHTVMIEVKDDGNGLKQKHLSYGHKSSSGLGLFTIRERLKYLGGSLDIESKPTKGCKVVMTLPLKT